MFEKILPQDVSCIYSENAKCFNACGRPMRNISLYITLFPQFM